VRKNSTHLLNERAQGWLRFLWRKATTEDDWSEDGEPHPWWDRYSTAPMMNFPRFDLSESSYAIGLMADMTPAWREVYAAILDGLAERHLTYWAAVDWLTQFGSDPNRKNYPQAWKDTLIPKHLFGDYDTPGWTANGIEPWGLQKDPIGAEGNLFFKGWLNLVMSLHHYVSGEKKWESPFEVAGLERTRFEWTQTKLANHLVELWSRHPAGPHCENTKVWPLCLSAAGLGLQLYDTMSGTSTHNVFESWLEYAKENYFGIDDSNKLRWTTFYYDPILDEHMRHGPSDALPTSLYILPQDPGYAEFLYHAAVTRMGWPDQNKPFRAPNDPRFIALGMALAKEWGDDPTLSRLNDYADANFEPRAFGTDNSEFGWWFNFGEKWPRGQISALLIMAEVGSKGAWRRLFHEPNLWKFEAPTVEGVDFPSLGITEAWNDPDAGILHIQTCVASSNLKGMPTTFCVTNLPDAGAVQIICDNQSFGLWRKTDAHTIVIDSDIAVHDFQITTGFRRKNIPTKNKRTQGTSDGSIPRMNAQAVTTSHLMMTTGLARAPSFSCCHTINTSALHHP